MKSFIRKYPIRTYCISTFLLAGIMFLLNMFVFPGAQKYAIIFPQFAPGVVGIILVGLTKGLKGLKKLIECFSSSKEINKWITLCIMVAIIMVGVSYCVLSIVNAGYVQAPTMEKISASLFCLLGIIIGSIGEEVGWRGFMLPHLQLKFSPIISSLILGIVWGVYYLNFEFGIVGFILYTVTVIEISILFTWFYNKTNGNILIVVIFHSVLNFTTRVLVFSQIGIKLFIIESFVFGLSCIFVLTVSDLNSPSKIDKDTLLFKGHGE